MHDLTSYTYGHLELTDVWKMSWDSFIKNKGAQGFMHIPWRTLAEASSLALLIPWFLGPFIHRQSRFPGSNSLLAEALLEAME